MVEKPEPLKSPQRAGLALFNLGFRPFFLFAAIFAVLGMLQWMLVYHGAVRFHPGNLSLFQWHAHEMIFGYTMAVIAGFLLTSVRNWTGQQTPVGAALAGITALWVVSRIAFAIGEPAIVVGLVSNLGFMLGLFWGIGSRIFRVRQWRQSGILMVLAALILAELTVLIGLLHVDQWLVTQAIHLGFYLVVMLILIMARRIVPFFTERGVGYPCTLRQSQSLDIIATLGFILYVVTALSGIHQAFGAVSAAVVSVAHSIRLINWHTAGIWRKPLLWSLFLSQAFIVVGLMMAVVSYWIPVSSYLVLHAFALGGVGFITLSMMSRVSLGHTGRDVHNPPGIVTTLLLVMILATLVRVALPLVAPLHHVSWIGVSQLLWLIAFGLFVFHYLPILLAPRPDGREG